MKSRKYEATEGVGTSHFFKNLSDAIEITMRSIGITTFHCFPQLHLFNKAAKP
jgi:hypothetical protein